VHHRLTRARVAALAEQALEGAAHFLVSGWLDYAVPLSALEIDANAPVVERGKRECGHPRPMASVARGGLPFQAPSTRRRLVRAPVRRRSANGFERTFDRNGQATRERKKRGRRVRSTLFRRHRHPGFARFAPIVLLIKDRDTARYRPP